MGFLIILMESVTYLTIMSTNKPGSFPVPIFIGHIFFIITGILYSIYWVIQYYDIAGNFTPLLPFLFLGSILIGFIGISLFYVSSGTLLNSQNWPIIITGIAIFILSLVIMDRVFHRPFTSEIFFAFLWAISEMNIMYSVYKSGCIPKAAFNIIAAGVLACTAVNLVCYRIHFLLPDFERFINGLIPYCVVTFLMVAILIILFLNRNASD